MTSTFTSVLYTFIILVLVFLSIPLISMIATSFDIMVINRKTKIVRKKLDVIIKKEIDILKDFNRSNIFSGMEKANGLCDLNKDFFNTVDELGLEIKRETK